MRSKCTCLVKNESLYVNNCNNNGSRHYLKESMDNKLAKNSVGLRAIKHISTNSMLLFSTIYSSSVGWFFDTQTYSLVRKD